MRICGVVASLGSGGAERVMTELCRAWAARGDHVTLVTLDGTGRDFYQMPPGVARVALGVSGVSRSASDALVKNVRRLRAVRSAVLAAQPDVVVSFTDRTNILVLLAMQGSRIPVFASERNDPRVQGPGRAWAVIRRVAYPQAAGLIVQTRGLRDWASRFVSLDRVHVIPNPVRITAVDAAPAGERPHRIVAMGRLVRQKSFDRLIRAFAATRETRHDWSLAIYGEGPDRPALETLMDELSVREVVSLPGRTSDPDAALQHASIFALSSRHEGFPNVLLEACVAGCACVSTDCKSGPSDILTNGESGLLVPVDDVGALAEGLLQLMHDPALRSRFGAAARQGTSRFVMEQVLADWDRAFSSVVPAKMRVAA